MTIPAVLVDIEPVYSSTHEIARTLFHISGQEEIFLAFGTDADYIAHTAVGETVMIEISSMVTLLSSERAVLVDSAKVVPATSANFLTQRNAA